MLVDFEEAKSIVDKYIEDLYNAMHEGFNRYFQLSPGDKLDIRPTTKAGVVHDFQVKEIKKVVDMHERLNFLQYGELSLLLIEDKFAVKIKKMDLNRKSRNQPTQQVHDFLNQNLSLPGFPEVISLQLGYTLDLFGNLNDVFIVCPNGQYDNFWEWGLDSGSKNVYQLLPAATENGEKLKQDQQKKSNRYSQQQGETAKDDKT